MTTITNDRGLYTVRLMVRNPSKTANKAWYCKRIIITTRNESEAIGAKMAEDGDLDVEQLLINHKERLEL